MSTNRRLQNKQVRINSSNKTPPADLRPISSSIALIVMDYETIEDHDGIRFSWNVWPASKSEASKLVVPISCLYSPLKEHRDMTVLPYEPVVCKSPCRAILNPFCQVDYVSKFWICPFCLQRNQFPPHYRDISYENPPSELMPTATTVEYTLARPCVTPPLFLILVDTSLEEGDMQALREALLVTLSLIPADALVGLITFGTLVRVHELGFTLIQKSYVFQGRKDYTLAQVQDMLGLVKDSQHSHAALPSLGRFFLPMEAVEITLQSLFERLPRDPFPVDADKRPQRAIGVAVSVAVSLLESVAFNTGARILLFTGGACTYGPGMVVGTELKEAIRSHHTINTGSAKYFKLATEYYEGLARRLTANGHSMDILAGCLDQVGIAEMRMLAEASGGSIVMSDAFNTNVFKQSCQQLLARDADNKLKTGFNGILELMVSRELKINGIIGPLVSFHKKNPTVSETVPLCTLLPHF